MRERGSRRQNLDFNKSDAVLECPTGYSNGSLKMHRGFILLQPWVTILGGVELLFKPFRWVVPKIWSAMARQLKAVGAKQTRFNLHFVARDFPHTQWGKGSVGDKPVTCITTKWYVTNAPGSGFWMAARLVKAHLLQPAPKSLMHANVAVRAELKEMASVFEPKIADNSLKLFRFSVNWKNLVWALANQGNGCSS